MNTVASETSVTTLPSIDIGASGETHHPAHGSLREHDSVISLFTRSSGEEETAGVVKSTDLSGAAEETSANVDEVRSTTPSEDGDMLVPIQATIGLGAANGDTASDILQIQMMDSFRAAVRHAYYGTVLLKGHFDYACCVKSAITPSKEDHRTCEAFVEASDHEIISERKTVTWDYIYTHCTAAIELYAYIYSHEVLGHRAEHGLQHNEGATYDGVQWKIPGCGLFSHLEASVDPEHSELWQLETPANESAASSVETSPVATKDSDGVEKFDKLASDRLPFGTPRQNRLSTPEDARGHDAGLEQPPPPTSALP
ncbi:hypothetical protein C8Q70DRAFT_936516 [Cubamyces menziesii]|nr:hypothetical protein C8Q70DRAFT_936516 [Cubamyces menziesii]